MNRVSTPQQPDAAMPEDRNQPLIHDSAGTDQSKYLIHSRPEIAAILNTLAKSATVVTAYFDGGSDFVLTSIAGVKPDQDKVFVDYGADAAANQRALQTRDITFVATHERIRIQFSAESLRAARLGGREVLSMALPASLLRLQRREYFRISTPLTRPLLCRIPPLRARPQATAEVTIVDISCGGISVIDFTEPAGIETGARFRNCRIRLPDLGEVTTDIEVRSTFEVTFKNGAKHRRAGCEFIGMRERDRALIQRYISRLERERRDLAGAR